MKRFPILVFILLLSQLLYAQKPEHFEFGESESKLEKLFTTLYSDTLADRASLTGEIRNEMQFVLAMDGSMDFSFSRLNRIGIISSEDGEIRVFTWHVMEDPDTYRYYGFVQVASRKDRVKLFELRDNLKPQRNVFNPVQSPDNWYGKLYYQVLTNKHRRKTYYTLMGMDFNDSRSTIKTAEIISLVRKQPRFENERFVKGTEHVNRMVLEYSDQVAITVRYDPQMDMIIFDHLAPFHPVYKKNLEFYGPDGSFDGLEFEDGYWIYRDDVDARNKD